MVAAPPVPGGSRANSSKVEVVSPGKKQEIYRKEGQRKDMTAVPPGKGRGRFRRTHEAAVASLKKVYGAYCLAYRNFAGMNPRPHRFPGGHYWYP